MGANLKKLCIIDIESTCWNRDLSLADGAIQGDPPNEIIEIGIAEINLKNEQIIQHPSIIVKPRFTKISKFCTELTGWTQEAIDEKGVDILDALVIFDDKFGTTCNCIWGSWGEYDRYKLSSLTGRPGLFYLYGIKSEDNPFDKFRAHYNLKTMMAIKHRLSREMGMARALNFYGLSLEGKHHNGGDDAANTAKLALKILS
jgi:inhibitor of KinA sporulation pathway (predicted exonuclease)